MARIGVVGGGVVGSATGRGLMEWGHDVVFCDTSDSAIDRLQTLGLAAVKPDEFRDIITDFTMISVPSPTVDRRTNLDYVKAAASELGVRLRRMPRGHIVVVRSTVVPGTTAGIITPILTEQSGLRPEIDFHVAYNPEFLREVSAREDFLSPWVTVIGTFTHPALRAVRRLYEEVVPEGSIIEVDVATAEMIKCTSNLYNATKISFSNEIWQVARSLGIDGDTVLRTVARTAEGMWNPSYGTRGGLPYGGACLPKDTTAFATFARSLGFSMELLGAVIAVNERLADFTAYRLLDGAQGEPGATISLLPHPAATNGARPADGVRIESDLGDSAAAGS